MLNRRSRLLRPCDGQIILSALASLPYPEKPGRR